jgi:hypothetical protein
MKATTLVRPIFPTFLAWALALPCVVPADVLAQHAHGDLLIGSDADGGGNLVVDYPFDERPLVPVSASGFPGLFTSTAPGFKPAADEPDEGVFALDVPTTVGLEIMAMDSNVQVQMGMSVLAAVGDSATIGTHDDTDPELSGLHTHPIFLLSLVGEGPGGFAEGDFSFRVYDDGATYGDSGIHKLKLSNGYLPAIEEPTRASLACRAAVAKAMRKLSGEVQKRVGACLDKALVAAEPADVLASCNPNPTVAKSLAGRLDTALAKAIASTAKTCGTLTDTSTPFTASAVSTHLGMASCRAQEVSAATYGEGRDALETALLAAGGDGTCPASICTGGVLAGTACDNDDDCSVEHALEMALPCVKAAAHEEE